MAPFARMPQSPLKRHLTPSPRPARTFIHILQETRLAKKIHSIQHSPTPNPKKNLSKLQCRQVSSNHFHSVRFQVNARSLTAQQRKRLFLVGFRSGSGFQFPEPAELGLLAKAEKTGRGGDRVGSLGVYPHCDTRESSLSPLLCYKLENLPFYMVDESLGSPFCCITEVVMSCPTALGRDQGQ